MRTTTVIKKMNTVCGKALTYLETTGEPNRFHSTEGPAIIYSKDEKKAPEYYLFGIKYPKNKWQELVNQSKITPSADGFKLDF